MSRFVVELHTSSYRGDHAADVVIALDTSETETIPELVNRVARTRSVVLVKERGDLLRLGPEDFIVIRSIVEAKGDVDGPF